jgi:hypothetical protein
LRSSIVFVLAVATAFAQLLPSQPSESPWGFQVAGNETLDSLFRQNYGTSQLSAADFRRLVIDLNPTIVFSAGNGALRPSRPSALLVLPDPANPDGKFAWFGCDEKLAGRDISPFVAARLDQLAKEHGGHSGAHAFYITRFRQRPGDDLLWLVRNSTLGAPTAVVPMDENERYAVVNAVVALGKYVH